MEQLIKLCEKFNCKYLQNEKMSLHTTFKIGGNARLVV
ncbi:MAG TPA: UDP-N-acetylenolpyruvoylglucosamine reductase, partial [Ruminococcaceae bacterium]|nr:UDP-N-acetylenolpyruvoylglucosamine reductase [Oscillospiraceae bacterium]